MTTETQSNTDDNVNMYFLAVVAVVERELLALVGCRAFIACHTRCRLGPWVAGCNHVEPHITVVLGKLWALCETLVQIEKM